MRILSRSGLLLWCRATLARPRAILILLLHLLSHGVYYALEAAHRHRLLLYQLDLLGLFDNLTEGIFTLFLAFFFALFGFRWLLGACFALLPIGTLRSGCVAVSCTVATLRIFLFFFDFCLLCVLVHEVV